MAEPEVKHPLDPLVAAEIRGAVAVLRRDRGVGQAWRFASIELREPSKEVVRSFSEGDPIHREAVVICWDRANGEAYKATVDIGADAVTTWEHRPGEQPNMTEDEFYEADAAMRRDPRVIEALADRGVTDMDRVLIDTWAYGGFLVPEAHRGRRLGWADVWYRRQEGANPYANPITGLHFIVDLNAMELLEVEDEQRLEEPRSMGEYVPELIPGTRRGATSSRSRSPSPRARRSRSTAGSFAGRSGGCGSASTTARASCSTRWATTTAAGPARSHTGCPSPRWSCPTSTRRPITTGARRSTSASGASGS